jgi:hypothetical protein
VRVGYPPAAPELTVNVLSHLRGEEGKSHMASGVVDVEIHEHERLPSAEGEPPTNYRNRHGWAYQDRQQMVGSVSR